MSTSIYVKGEISYIVFACTCIKKWEGYTQTKKVVIWEGRQMGDRGRNKTPPTTEFWRIMKNIPK